MKLTLPAILVACAVFVADSAQAKPFTIPMTRTSKSYLIGGEVASDGIGLPGVSAGDPYNAAFSWEPSVADATPGDPNTGTYPQTSPLEFTIEIGDNLFTTSSYNVIINNDDPSDDDRLFVQSLAGTVRQNGVLDPTLELILEFNDATQSVFSDLTIPEGLMLGDFPSGNFSFVIDNGTDILSLTPNSLQQFALTPEPSSFILGGVVIVMFVAFAAWKRRKQRAYATA